MDRTDIHPCKGCVPFFLKNCLNLPSHTEFHFFGGTLGKCKCCDTISRSIVNPNPISNPSSNDFRFARSCPCNYQNPTFWRLYSFCLRSIQAIYKCICELRFVFHKSGLQSFRILRQCLLGSSNRLEIVGPTREIKVSINESCSIPTA